jgi:hypothetical protein
MTIEERTDSAGWIGALPYLHPNCPNAAAGVS